MKFALRISRLLFKKVLIKAIAALAGIIAPFLAALAVFAVLFGFVYFSVFMLPRFIAEGAGTPGVIYNWGEGDTWTLKRDIELIFKYKGMDYTWLSQFESTEALAAQAPAASGNGADHNTTVGDVWKGHMGFKFKTPRISNTEFDTIFRAKAEEYALDYELLKALAWAESTFDPNARSPRNCKGLMQLSPALIKEYKIKDPYDPVENIDGGARYLRKLLDRFDDVELAIAAYNAGPGAVEKHERIPPYPETQNHVKKVMAAYNGKRMLAPIKDAQSSVISEREQVEPHRVHWSLLGAMDRVIGDPIVHGKHGPETELGRGRLPSPEKRFNELEPELEWQDFELYYYHKWTEYHYKEDSEGNRVKVSETYTEKYTHTIRLLASADTYEAKHLYTWEEEVTEKEGKGWYKKVIIPKLADYQKSGPYFERLRVVLAEYDLTANIELELVLRIAMNTDQQYYLDANMTSSLLELLGGTETGYYAGTGELAWPLNGPITSTFGYRVHPVTGEYRMHTGIDIACPRGAAVRSAADGIVIFAGNNGGYGKCMIIDHGKYRTLYAHLLSYETKPGDEVEMGQIIAKADSTGVSTGDHLHFEVRTGVNKTQFIDPLKILN